MKPKFFLLFVCMITSYLYADKFSNQLITAKTPFGVSDKKFQRIEQRQITEKDKQIQSVLFQAEQKKIKVNAGVRVSGKHTKVMSHRDVILPIADEQLIPKEIIGNQLNRIAPSAIYSNSFVPKSANRYREMKERLIEEQGHNKSGGMSKISGEVDSSDVNIDGIYYTLNQDYSATVISNPTEYTGVINIPASFNFEGHEYTVKSIGYKAFYRNDIEAVNMPVTIKEIDDYAFSYCELLTSVTFPEGLSSIGDFAFMYCQNIGYFSIPVSVSSIGKGTFSGCPHLNEISVNTGNAYFSSLNGVLFSKDQSTLYQYPIARSVSNYEIPASTKTIRYSAFESAENLTSITIPTSVTNLEYFSFAACTGLTTISLPASVKVIQDYAFEYCDNLVAVNVDSSNPDFSSVDGVFYDKYQNKLILYPIGKTATSFTIPSTVKILGPACLETCYNLKTVVIPSSVTTIGHYVFWYSGNLSSINSQIVTPVDLTNSYYVFEGVNFDACNLFVPAGAKSLYQQADQWNDFNNIYESGVQPIGTYFVQDSIAYRVTSGNTIEISDGINYSGNVIIPSSVNFAGISYFVNAIGDYAFYDSDVTAVQLPATILTIGESAFQYCQGLQSLILPTSVITIKASAFRQCALLNNINIPASVQFIGEYAFRYCPANTAFNVDAQNQYFKSVNGVLFNKSVTKLIQYPIANTSATYVIPSTVDTIGARAMANCENLTNINIPTSVDVIKNEAFVSNYGLTQINIPSSVVIIGDFAFGFCYNLSNIYVDVNNTGFSSDNGVLMDKTKTSLIYYPAGKAAKKYTVPGTVKLIGPYAFYNDTVIHEVVMPAGLHTIDYAAFYNCPDLSIIDLPASLININSRVFLSSGIQNINIPASVSFIGTYAFGSCSKLQNLHVDENNLLFSSMDGVLFNKEMSTLLQYPSGKTDSIYVIQESVTTIAEGAVEDAANLKTITIPQDVTTISHYAFGNCSSLQTILVFSEYPVDLSNSYSVFYGVDKANCALWVPRDAVSLYQDAAQWKDFENIIGWYYQSDYFTVDSIDYMIIDTNTVAVIGAEMPDGLLVIPSNVSYDGVNYVVTAINSWGFSSERQMTGVYIPATVSYIGDYAFFDCPSLEYLNVDTANVYYKSMAGVLFDKQINTLIQYPAAKKDVIYQVPTPVSTIKTYAFSQCNYLVDVNIPAGVSNIEVVAFFLADNLKHFVVAENNTDYSSNTDGVLFNKTKTKLTQYPLGRLESTYNIPTTVDSIETAAFYGAKKLQTVNLPNSVKVISYSAFSESSLTQVMIPASVTSIGEFAFEYCYGLSAINVDSNNQHYCSQNGVLFSKDMLTLILHPIKSADTEYVIPPTITTLAPSCFEENSNLRTVEIPASVTEIGDWAFWYAKNLSAVYTRATTPVNIDNSQGVFMDVNDSCALYIPKGTMSLYLAADQWSDFMFIHEFDYSAVENPDSDEQQIIYNPQNRTVSLTRADNAHTIFVYSANGQLNLQQTLNPDEVMSVEGLPKGIYIIRVNKNSKMLTRKIIL